MKNIIFSFLLLFITIGCSYIPKIDKNNKISLTTSNQISSDEIKPQWWEYSEDPILKELITMILQANPDLKIAKYNIEKSIQAINLVKSQDGPNIDVTGGIQRQRTPKFGTVPPPFNGKLINSGSLNLQGNYTLDIFNKIGSLEKEAQYKSKAATLSKETIKLNISIQTAKLYEYWKYLQFEKNNLDTQLQTLNSLYQIEKIKYRIGNGVQDDVFAIENKIRTLENLISQNEINSKITLNSLTQLAGTIRDKEIISLLNKNTTPQHLKVIIPNEIDSNIIINRPDVSYYLMLIKAQESHLDSLKTDFYPHFTINGEYGFNAVNLNKVLHRGSLAGLISGGLYLPIFHMGAIRSNYKIAGIDLNIIIEEYNKTVLNSYMNVNNHLYTVKTMSDMLKKADQNLENDRTTFTNNSKKYEIGNISKYQYLSSQIAWLNSQLQNEQQHFNFKNEQLNFINSIGGIYLGGNNGNK